jgi:hypothetical protein
MRRLARSCSSAGLAEALGGVKAGQPVHVVVAVFLGQQRLAHAQVGVLAADAGLHAQVGEQLGAEDAVQGRVAVARFELADAARYRHVGTRERIEGAVVGAVVAAVLGVLGAGLQAPGRPQHALVVHRDVEDARAAVRDPDIVQRVALGAQAVVVVDRVVAVAGLAAVAQVELQFLARLAALVAVRGAETEVLRRRVLVRQRTVVGARQQVRAVAQAGAGAVVVVLALRVAEGGAGLVALAHVIGQGRAERHGLRGGAAAAARIEAADHLAGLRIEVLALRQAVVAALHPCARRYSR